MTTTFHTAPPFDAELETVLDFVNQTLSPTLTLADLPALRADPGTPSLAQLLAGRPITHEERLIPGPAGAPDVIVSIFRHAGQKPGGPGFFFTHLGGMIFGDRFVGISTILPWGRAARPRHRDRRVPARAGAPGTGRPKRQLRRPAVDRRTRRQSRLRRRPAGRGRGQRRRRTHRRSRPTSPRPARPPAGRADLDVRDARRTQRHRIQPAFFWAGLVRVAVLHHVTLSINSICHLLGDRPWDAPVGPPTSGRWRSCR